MTHCTVSRDFTFYSDVNSFVSLSFVSILFICFNFIHLFHLY